MMTTMNRVEPRRSLTCYLKVYDAETGVMLGHLADVNSSGMRMVGAQSLVQGRDYALRIEVPQEMFRGGDIRCSAMVRWCGLDINPDLRAAGLQFTDVSPGDSARIARLIDRLAFTY